MSQKEGHHNSQKIFLDNTYETNNPKVIKKSNTSYEYILPNPIILNPLDSHSIYIGVESVSLPLNIYAINSDNNQLYISGATPIVIPFGNYEINQLVSSVNELLLASATFTDMSVTYNPISSKVTFVTSGSRTELDMASRPNSAVKLFGINPSDTPKTLPYTAEAPVNLLYTSGVTLRMTNHTSTNQDTSINTGGNTSLLRMVLNTPNFTVCQHSNNSPQLVKINSKVVTSIEIGLFDDNQESLKLIDETPYIIVLRVEFKKQDENVIGKSDTQNRVIQRDNDNKT